MTGTNEFLPYAIGTGANVESQTDYAADAITTYGAVAGTAQASNANKAWRQATSMVSAIGAFIAGQGNNALDNGNISTLTTAFLDALISLFKATIQSSTPNIPIISGNTYNETATITVNTKSTIIAFGFFNCFNVPGNQIEAQLTNNFNSAASGGYGYLSQGLTILITAVPSGTTVNIPLSVTPSASGVNTTGTLQVVALAIPTP